MFRAMKHKTEKEAYQQVLSDLESQGYAVNLYTIGIGTLGHWLPHPEQIF